MYHQVPCDHCIFHCSDSRNSSYSWWKVYWKLFWWFFFPHVMYHFLLLKFLLLSCCLLLFFPVFCLTFCCALTIFTDFGIVHSLIYLISFEYPMVPGYFQGVGKAAAKQIPVIVDCTISVHCNWIFCFCYQAFSTQKLFAICVFLLHRILLWFLVAIFSHAIEHFDRLF